MTNAIGAAGLNGEVICLDKFAYGGVGITQSVTISCGDGLWEAPNSNDLVIINTPSGADVVIEGLVIDGSGLVGNSIIVQGQGALHLRRVRSGNNGGGTHGLNFAPTGPASLHITDSVFYNNSGSGVLIKPASGGSANVHIRNSRFEHNLHGLFADGSNGVVNVNMAESAAVDNQGNGVGAFAPSSSSVTVEVTTSQITGNFTNGIGSLGLGTGSVAVEIGNSQITRNVNGLNHSGSGQIVTLGGNQLRRNLNDGAFTDSAATQ